MKILVLSILLCSLVLVKSSDVLELNKNNYDDTLSEKEYVFVKYYAPWCGHCKRMAPDYEVVATYFKNKKNLAIAKVNADEESELSSKAQVMGFPTLKFYHKGKEVKGYEGQRTAGALIKWIKKEANFPLSTLLKDEAGLKEFLEENGNNALIGVFKDNNDEHYKKFINDIKSDDIGLYEGFAIGEVFDQELAKSLVEGVVPSLKLYRSFNSEPLTLKGVEELKDPRRWLILNGVPLFREYQQSNYKLYEFLNQKLLLAFLDKDDEKLKESQDVLEKIAEKVKGQMSVAWFDGVKYRVTIGKVGLDKDASLPAYSVMDIDRNLFYPYKNEDTSSDALNKWVSGIIDGSIQPNYKSQAIPKEQKEAVLVVVRDTFEKVAYDTTKDVLIEFYAPWCGACTTFTPTYLKLAEDLKDVKNLVIGKVDSTENDTPLRIKSYPTIYFFPSNNKDKPISYEGEREIPDILDFLKKNAVASKDELVAYDEKKKAEEEKKKSEEKVEEKPTDEVKGKKINDEL